MERGTGWQRIHKTAYEKLNPGKTWIQPPEDFVDAAYQDNVCYLSLSGPQRNMIFMLDEMSPVSMLTIEIPVDLCTATGLSPRSVTALQHSHIRMVWSCLTLSDCSLGHQ